MVPLNCFLTVVHLYCTAYICSIVSYTNFWGLINSIIGYYAQSWLLLLLGSSLCCLRRCHFLEKTQIQREPLTHPCCSLRMIPFFFLTLSGYRIHSVWMDQRTYERHALVTTRSKWRELTQWATVNDEPWNESPKLCRCE